MDILCATCQEPWEHHGLLFDLPYEAWDGDDGSPSHNVVKKFTMSDEKTSIPLFIRTELADRGWKFGKSIVTVLRCSCCEENLEDYPELKEDLDERIALRTEAEATLGSDLDGLISTLCGIDRYLDNQNA